MVQFFETGPSHAGRLGEALGMAMAPGLQEGVQYSLNRRRLQNAFSEAEKSIGEMQKTGKYEPFTLFSSLAKAGAGIPGWGQVLAEGFPALSTQIRNEILQNRSQIPGNRVGNGPLSQAIYGQPQNEDIPQNVQSMQGAGQQMGSNLHIAPATQARPQIPPSVKGGAVNIDPVGAPSLLTRAQQIYADNVDILGPEGALQKAQVETGIQQQDIQNAILSKKATQELAGGERQLEESFYNKYLPEFESKYLNSAGQSTLDSFAKNKFRQFSEEKRNLSDPQRAAYATEKTNRWINQRRSVEKAMTPTLIARWFDSKNTKDILNLIKGSIKPFTSQGDTEKEIAIAALADQGLSLPEAYDAVYDTPQAVEKYINNLGRFPKFEAPPYGFTESVKKKRAEELKLESSLVDNLGKKLPTILSPEDSLISILYKLMEKGWTQQAYGRALDIAEQNGLKLSERQQMERSQLTQDMRPGFWDILKNPGKY